MTCVAGFIDEKGVYFGADSMALGADGHSAYTIAESETKILKYENNEMVIGFAGPLRALNLMRHDFAPPYHPVELEVDPYLVRMFVPELRSTLKEGDVLSDEDGGIDLSLLVAYRHRLFEIGGDFSIVPLSMNYHAVGSGSHVAIGSLASLLSLVDYDPKVVLKTALQCAAEHTAFVRPPYRCQIIEYEDEPDE